MPNFRLVSLNARFLLKIDLICLATGIVELLTSFHSFFFFFFMHFNFNKIQELDSHLNILEISLRYPVSGDYGSSVCPTILPREVLQTGESLEGPVNRGVYQVKQTVYKLPQCVYFFIFFGNSVTYKLKLIFEPPHEKTNNLHMRKQRRRSASRLPKS